MQAGKMEMEAQEGGTATKSESTPPQSPPSPGDSAASSLVAGTSASAKRGCSGRPDKGDEGGQDKIPGEGDDGGVSGSEASDDEGADPSSNDGDGDSDEWSTVSEDDGTSSEEEDDDEMDDTGSSSDGESSSGTGSVASGDEDGGELELHPMKNPLILKSMFDLCPPPLLADFRLVCKQWRDLSLEPWRSSITLRFEQNCRGKVELHVGDAQLCRRHQGTDALPLKKFLKYVEAPKNQCQLKPFRRFRLVGFMFPISGYRDARIRELWELVKRDGKAISLYMCSFRDVEVFRDVIYKDCPNLQHLEVVRCRIDSPEIVAMELWMGPLGRLFAPARKEPFAVGVYPEHPHLKSLAIEMADVMEMDRFPLTWLELFSQFPSLTRFSEIVDMSNIVGEDDHPFPIRELLPLLEAIQTIKRSDHRKLPLKEVVLEPILDISQEQDFRQALNLILELRLPLESFKLGMDGVTQLRLDELVGAAGIDAGPLRSLTVYKTECGISTWRFPFAEQLDNLEVLIMTGGASWENMGWLKLVPNLWMLEITDEPPGREEYRASKTSLAMISKAGDQELGHIKLLKMGTLTCNYALSEEDIRRLASWFPNLTQLRMVLEDKLVPVVCEQWPDLEVLTVIGAELTDEGVTGLGAGQAVEELDRKEPAPNLTLLQKLESFKYSNSEKISDVSIFNGFLKLSQLKYLHLGKTEGLSQEAKAELKRKEDIFLELY